MARTAAALVAGVLALVLMPHATPTASAAATGSGTPRLQAPFSLTMAAGGGTLLLRDGDPYAIETPTSITGTVDGPSEDGLDGGTGAITNGTFTTPEIHIEQQLTAPPDPVTARVYIDATFSQVTPGNLTGTIDEDGNVFVHTNLAVNLHVEVGRNPIILSADCISSPINLTLNSVAPHDGTKVTLANNNFSIPAPAAGGACESNVREAMIEQLAGPGHSISLTLEGPLPKPTTPKECSETDLAVSPEGGSLAGKPVTLSATVAPGDLCEAAEDPTGFVDFFDGDELLTSVALEADGSAELVTTELPAGLRSLSARYKGDALWGRSASDPVDHLISANPALTWDLPATVRIDGPPTDFSVTATNTGLGQSLENVRLDITMQRIAGTAPIGPVPAVGDRITLSQVDGVDLTPVPLTSTGSGSNEQLKGSIGAGTGVPLPIGAELVEDLQLGFPANGTVTPNGCGSGDRLCPGPLRVTFDLHLVDPDTGDIVETLLSEVGSTTMNEATRRATTIVAGAPAIPPLVPATPAISPQVVRAGNNITVNQLAVDPRLAGVNPAGAMAFSIDGVPVGVLRAGTPPSGGYQTEVTFAPGSSYLIPVPATTGPGTHSLALRYSGDTLFQPAVASFTFQVVATIGSVYECERPGLGTAYVGRANVIAQGLLPAVVPDDGQVAVVNPVLRLLFDRGPSAGGGNLLATSVAGFAGLDVTYSVDGTSSATGVTRTNSTRMDVTTGDPDQAYTFQNLAMGVTIDGEPGEALPIRIESFKVRVNGVGERLNCTPVSAPAVLGQVTVADTTLEVTPEGPVRVGSRVTLTAETAPASGGVIEFRDGTTTIGVVPVDEGQAAMATTALAEGEHSLTARYFGGLTIPTTTSDAVPLTVLPLPDCAPFAEEGNGAVVRLVYMELLHRCPDQAGYDHWKALLDGGTSRGAFARTISNTAEAQGILVDKAYDLMLSREPDTAGRAFWIGRLQGGYRYDRLLAALGGSPEFYALGGGTDEGFVTRLYQRLLLRAPDAAGLEHWLGELEAGTPRWRVAQAFTAAGEVRARLVKDAYVDMLDRQPNAEELAGGITYLGATGNLAGLYAQLIELQEFYDRAQEFPDFDAP